MSDLPRKKDAGAGAAGSHLNQVGGAFRLEQPEELVCQLGICDGTGWIVDADDNATSCECRDRRIARNKARGISSVIPTRYMGVGFDRPPVSDMARRPELAPVMDAITDYCSNIEERLDKGRGLWLMGDVGTGKTTLAMLISKTALAANRTVAIYSVPRLLARIRRTYDAEPGGDSYTSFFRKLTSVDLLHLDDLGAEKRSDWVLEQLYAVVNERYESQRAVMVTMNSTSEGEGSGPPVDWMSALEEQIGRRTVSRLVEICGDPLPLFGDDLRYRIGA